MNALNSTISRVDSQTVNSRMWPETEKTRQLMFKAKGGDQSAVNQLLDRHRNSLDHLVRMRLDKKIQNRVGVSDVVQDVLVEANRRLSRYLESPAMPFHLWVRQIARDRIIDAHRRHRVSAKRSVDRERRMVVPRGYDQSSVHLASLLGDSKASPVEVAIQKELARKVEASIALLGEKDAEVIVMRHYEQLTNQEISQVLNVSEATASMRYLRAIRRLKELINEAQSETSSPDESFAS